MTDHMKPIVTVNGSDPETMIRDRIAAREAIRQVMKALAEIAPNGRDYIGHPLALRWDTDTHRKRIAMLDKLYNELEEEALHIQDQMRPA